MSEAYDFVELRRWPVRVLVRTDLASTLGDWLLERRVVLPPDASRFASGRGGAWAFSLDDGRRAVYREYRRGGWLAHVIRRTYVGFEARPFREVAVAVRAQRRGVPTAEVLAARVSGRVAYRGAIVTSLIADALPALEALRAAATEADRIEIATAVGRAVGAMHRLGLVHADLNCGNLLVTRGANGPEARVIDLDRAWLCEPPVGARDRAAVLARLGRSLRKLDPDGLLATASDRAAFRVGYEEAVHLPCAC